MNTDTDMVFELPSRLQAIELAVERVMQRCCDCVTDRRKLNFHFRVGLTEAITNAMLYGNSQDPRKRVRVELCVEETSLVARVSDEGNGFDPSGVPDPTIPSNLEKPCGRGIFLMRQLLDEVRFNEEGNCVTLILHREPETGLGGGARA